MLRWCCSSARGCWRPCREGGLAVDISAEIVINKPRDEVAAFASDPDNDPAWIGGIVEAKTLTDPPFSKATKVARVASFLGRRMEYEPEVVEYEAGALVSMKAETPFPMTIRYTFADVQGGTKMTIRVQGGGSGFYSVAAPLLAMMVRRNVSQDLNRLKELLESEAPE